MLINYRHYTTKAMVDILSRECIFYSRGHFVDRGRLNKPDVISLRVLENVSKLSSAIVIDCEVRNNLEGVEEVLQQKGFVRDEVTAKQIKQWTIPFHHTLDAGKLVNTIMANLEEAVKNMPLLPYASPMQKALADYHGFMTSNIAKISYGDIMQHLGYWDESELFGKAAEADGADLEYLVAKYKKERWAAWASGDLIVPLFASEIEAIQFLKTRVMQVCRDRPTIRTIPPHKKGCLPNIYVLVDHTKNVKERVSWLRSEIDRLERPQGEVVCS